MTVPQAEQVFDDGYQRLIFSTRQPYQYLCIGLKFELRTDAELYPGSQARWIAVAPKGSRTELILYIPDEAWSHNQGVVGKSHAITLNVTDLQTVFEDLKSKGVISYKNRMSNPGELLPRSKIPKETISSWLSSPKAKNIRPDRMSWDVIEFSPSLILIYWKPDGLRNIPEKLFC